MWERGGWADSCCTEHKLNVPESVNWWRASSQQQVLHKWMRPAQVAGSEQLPRANVPPLSWPGGLWGWVSADGTDVLQHFVVPGTHTLYRGCLPWGSTVLGWERGIRKGPQTANSTACQISLPYILLGWSFAYPWLFSPSSFLSVDGQVSSQVCQFCILFHK